LKSDSKHEAIAILCTTLDNSLGHNVIYGGGVGMIRSLARIVTIGVLASSLTGCAAALIGAGAAGGYAIGRDSITNHFDLSQSRVFGVSRQVIQDMGLITEEDATRGRLKASVQEATVTVIVTPVSDETVKLQVKARKHLMPKLSVAESVYNEIFQRLE